MEIYHKDKGRNSELLQVGELGNKALVLYRAVAETTFIEDEVEKTQWCKFPAAAYVPAAALIKTVVLIERR